MALSTSATPALDNLVLQRGNAEGPLPSIRFRDEHSSSGLGPVRSPVQSFVKALEITLHIPLVLFPRHAVDPGCRFTLDSAERRVESLLREVVEKRRKTKLPVSLRCFAHTIQRTGRIMNPALCPGCVLLVRVPLDRAPFLHSRVIPGEPECGTFGSAPFTEPEWGTASFTSEYARPTALTWRSMTPSSVDAELRNYRHIDLVCASLRFCGLTQTDGQGIFHFFVLFGLFTLTANRGSSRLKSSKLSYWPF
jgi:hypothetical protein